MNTCTKKPYRAQWQALAALRAVRRACQRRGNRAPTGVHLCTPCRAWHLTSKSKTQRPPWVSPEARRG